ncbi:acylneuraminate cytidylyltransferase family protein [bacterium]|nr:acylneuraminate cytidylyltransferase family protein [bacterium]
MQHILLTLCARGGSKGIPGKNIKMIGGKHLIAYSIHHAKNFKKWLEQNNLANVKIELSTDSTEIIDVCKLYDLKTEYIRSSILANDTAGKQDVIKDLVLFSEKKNNVKYDLVVDLDVSAPMRTTSDLIEAYTDFYKREGLDVLFSVSEAKKNPYFNMVELNEDLTCSISKKPREPILSRQAAPKVYEMNASFYFYRRRFFENDKMYLFGNASIYSIKHECFDLDHQIDFDFLEFLIENNRLNFPIK